MNTKLMTRIFAALDAGEDPILNQLETDLDVALEDGAVDTEEYSMERLSDDTISILDKVNDEVTIAEVTPTGVNLSNPKSPEDTKVQEIDDTAYAEEAGGQKVPEDYENEITAEESQVPKAIVPGDEVKEFAKVKDGLIFRIGDSDFRVEFNKNGKGGVVSNIDDERQTFEFDSKTPFDSILKKISDEVEGNKKGVKLLNREFSSNNAGFNYSIMQCTVNSDNDRTEWKEVDSNLSYEDAQIKITNLRNQVDTSKYPYTDYKLMNQDIEKNFSGMSEKVQKHFARVSQPPYVIVKRWGGGGSPTRYELMNEKTAKEKVADPENTITLQHHSKGPINRYKISIVEGPFNDLDKAKERLVELKNGKNFSGMSEKVQKHFTKRHYEQHKDNMMDRNLANLSPEVRKLVEDRIAKRNKTDVKNFSDNLDKYYVVVHQNGVVDSWFGPYFHNEAEKAEDEIANELESGFTVGIWSLDTLLNKLSKQRKGNYTAEQVNSHAEKRTFSNKTFK